jgi:hypothetical protein
MQNILGNSVVELNLEEKKITTIRLIIVMRMQKFQFNSNVII